MIFTLSLHLLISQADINSSSAGGRHIVDMQEEISIIQKSITNIKAQMAEAMAVKEQASETDKIVIKIQSEAYRAYLTALGSAYDVPQDEMNAHIERAVKFAIERNTFKNVADLEKLKTGTDAWYSLGEKPGLFETLFGYQGAGKLVKERLPRVDEMTKAIASIYTLASKQNADAANVAAVKQQEDYASQFEKKRQEISVEIQTLEASLAVAKQWLHHNREHDRYMNESIKKLRLLSEMRTPEARIRTINSVSNSLEVLAGISEQLSPLAERLNAAVEILKTNVTRLDTNSASIKSLLK
jgi:hypothetical protein